MHTEMVLHDVRQQNSLWHSRVVPAAQAVEAIGWRIAWFVVLLKVLFAL